MDFLQTHDPLIIRNLYKKQGDNKTKNSKKGKSKKKSNKSKNNKTTDQNNFWPEPLAKGIEAVRGQVFKSAFVCRLFCFNGFPGQKKIPILKHLTFDIRGHAQTGLSELKEVFRDYFLQKHVYDGSDIVKLKDGGQCRIMLMGKKRFRGGGEEMKTRSRGQRNKEEEVLRPLVFVLPGLTSYGNTPHIENIVREGTRRGYDVVVICYRGLVGVRLTSP